MNQRMPLTRVIQRVGEEDDETEEVDDAEAFDLSSVTGDSGPTSLDEAFGEALEAAKEAITDFSSLPTGNATQVAKAKKAVTTARGLVDTLEDLTDQVETKRGQAEKLLDTWDGDFDGDDYAMLLDASSDFDKLLPKVKSKFSKLSEDFLEKSGQIGLAEEAMLQGAAQTQKLNALRAKWGSPALAKGHFDKHKSDTGAATEEEYLTRAAALNAKAAGGTIKRKERDGDTLTMDTATKDFTVMSSAGKIRTFFRPSDGIRYFNRQ